MMEEIRRIWGMVIAPGLGEQGITVGQVVSVVGLLLFGYLMSRFLGYLFGRRLANTKLRPDAIHTLKRIVFFTLLVLLFVVALGVLGIPITAFAFATGAIAIGIGFGAQNIINNFISGWILMAERPIRINDFIEIDTTHGTVEQIGNRSTRIRRTDGVHLLVPNSVLLERTVVNWTLVNNDIRTIVRVGVAYGSPPKKVAELIMEAVLQQAEVKARPKPIVVFEDFGDNALIFDVYFWCEVARERELRQVRSDIRFRLSELFEQNEIVVAYPQRDVHIDSLSPLQVRLLDDREVTE